MPVFHLNFREGNTITADVEGIVLDSIEDAYIEAFKSAQEILIELMQQRRKPMTCAFEITDQTSRILMTVPLSEVLGNFKCPRSAKLKTTIIETAIANARRSARLTAELSCELGILRKTMEATQNLLADRRRLNLL